MILCDLINFNVNTTWAYFMTIVAINKCNEYTLIKSIHLNKLDWLYFSIYHDELPYGSNMEDLIEPTVLRDYKDSVPKIL